MAQTEIETVLFLQKEAVEYLGVCDNTFRKLNIPYVKMLSSKRYSKDQLDKFIKENTKCHISGSTGRRGRTSTGKKSKTNSTQPTLNSGQNISFKEVLKKQTSAMQR
jgi:hypothetical protein